MFDLLTSIKKAWKESEFVIIKSSNDEFYTACIPALMVNKSHLDIIRSKGGHNFVVGFPYLLFRELSIPDQITAITGLISRYPILRSLVNPNKKNIFGEISFTTNYKKNKIGNNNDEMSRTIRKLGQIMDDYYNYKLTSYSLRDQFTSSFEIPGYIHLSRGTNGLLRKGQSYVDLGIALTEITNYSPCIFLTEIEKHKMGISPQIDQKTILNLWRSIKKVQKSEIHI